MKEVLITEYGNLKQLNIPLLKKEAIHLKLIF
jgi:hypothetical protein